jgi:hypothetical protein
MPAEVWNARLRKIAASSHIISTVAGNGSEGYTGTGGPSTAASVGLVLAVDIDPAGNVYFASGAHPGTPPAEGRIYRLNLALSVVATRTTTGVTALVEPADTSYSIAKLDLGTLTATAIDPATHDPSPPTAPLFHISQPSAIADHDGNGIDDVVVVFAATDVLSAAKAVRIEGQLAAPAGGRFASADVLLH